MKQFYRGKKVLVVGATSGIGKELCVQLLQMGAQVVGTGRRVELMQDLKAQYPQNFRSHFHDVQVTNPIDVYQKSSEFLTEFDFLILNSGYGQQNPSLHQSIERQTIHTNVNGVGLLLIEGFHRMRQQKKGTIVVVSSIAGIRGLRQSPSYSASKSFLSTLSEALNHMSVRNRLNVAIVDVRPGFVQTAMGNHPDAFWSAPVGKACRQILKGLINPPQVLYVTRRWRLLAFLFRFMPRWILQKF